MPLYRYNYFGHSIWFTVVRGNETSTKSGGMKDFGWLVDKLYEAALDSASTLTEISAPQEFFNELMWTLDRDKFDAIVSMIPRQESFSV
jgi:hypothetical protein